MKSANCPFCGTESLASIPEYGDEWRRIKSRILTRKGSIILCAGLGAIAEPYVLVYPTAHYTALAKLPGLVRADIIGALNECLDSKLFSSGTVTVFEHGGGVDSASSNSVTCLEHCHLHVIDGAYDLQQELKALYPTAKPFTLESTRSFSAPDGYLLAGHFSGGEKLNGIIVAQPACGSQFLRKMVAAKIGTSNWNWRLAPNSDAALRLVRQWKIPL